jgi:hypothetical protein
MLPPTHRARAATASASTRLLLESSQDRAFHRKTQKLMILATKVSIPPINIVIPRRKFLNSLRSPLTFSPIQQKGKTKQMTKSIRKISKAPNVSLYFLLFDLTEV